MAKHHLVGQKGEKIAKAFLENLGYTILESNWRFSKAEIDLIAKDGAVLVFIEVKTRTSAHWGPPESFVSTNKENLLLSAASVYMEESGHDWEVRFDIVSVLLLSNQAPQINHFKDAFFDQW